jgi:hypothetical protein
LENLGDRVGGFRGHYEIDAHCLCTLASALMPNNCVHTGRASQSR